jgi:hypothetical protein
MIPTRGFKTGEVRTITDGKESIDKVFVDGRVNPTITVTRGDVNLRTLEVSRHVPDLLKFQQAIEAVGKKIQWAVQ